METVYDTSNVCITALWRKLYACEHYKVHLRKHAYCLFKMIWTRSLINLIFQHFLKICH